MKSGDTRFGFSKRFDLGLLFGYNAQAMQAIAS